MADFFCGWFLRLVGFVFAIFVLYIIINPLTSPGEMVSVFTSPYLSAGAPALGEAKGLINFII